MDDFQTQLNALKAKVDTLDLSSGIGRDTETALRERLGLTSTTATQAFPVGSIFMATVATDPATLLGYGTWASFGDGRVLVSYKSADADFGTLLATGGEKTHQLTIAEMPTHHHLEYSNGTNGLGSGPAGIGQNTGPVSTGLNTGDTGGDGTHNNLQPYIVVQMWKRTA